MTQIKVFDEIFQYFFVVTKKKRKKKKKYALLTLYHFKDLCVTIIFYYSNFKFCRKLKERIF